MVDRDDAATPPPEPGLALARATSAITQARDLPELMRLARTAARVLTGADGVTLVLREADQCRYADEDAIGPLWKGQRFPLTSCISGWVMLHDEAVAIGDIYADARVPHEAYRATFVRSLSMVPIRRGEPLGAIGCYWARQDGAGDATLHMQQIIADAVGLAFERMEMRRRLEAVQQRAKDTWRESPDASDRAESSYRLLVEQAPDGIFVSSGDGRFLDVNEAGARVLGYSREEILVRHIADIVVPEEIARIPLEMSRLDAGSIATSEWLFLRKDGTTFPGEVVGRRLPDGRLQGILRDMSEHHRVQAALRESESFHRQTLESIPGMVFTTRADGYCDYQSLQWVDYTGVPMPQHLGDGWNSLLHAEDRARALAAWRNAVAQRAPYDLEYRVRRHDGAYDWFHVVARPIRDEHGSIVRWFGVATNIERLKSAEEQRIATLERQRDTLVREVHHRIKNHLQGVTGLLNSAKNDSPHIAEPLQRAIAQIHAVAQVYGLQSRNLDAGLTLAELVETAANNAADPVLLEIIAPTDGTPSMVAGDGAVAIALVINELITNGIKHRRDTHPAHPVRVSLAIDSATARITIRNEPALLPAGFDFADAKGLGNGLELVAALLPGSTAELVIRQRGVGVEAILTLHAPHAAAC